MVQGRAIERVRPCTFDLFRVAEGLRLWALGRGLAHMLSHFVGRRAQLVAVGLAALTAAIVVTAASIQAETANVSVTSGGELSITTAPIDLGGITLNGTDQTASSAAVSNDWTIVDSRGTGDGYNVTIDTTDFSDGLGNTLDVSSAASLFKIKVTAPNIVQLAGGANPTSTVQTLTTIPEAPNTPLKILSAGLGEGMGTYAVHPEFTLGVPANTVAGSYTSTVTVTITSGP